MNASKTVSPENMRRVQSVITQYGYMPNNAAKTLRAKKTNTIGVLVEDIAGFSTPGIINGISEFAEQNGYYMLLNDLRMLESLFNKYDQITYHKNKINDSMSLLLFGAKVDAVIYISMFDRDITGIINPINKPLIVAYSYSNDPNVFSVTYDNEYISTEVTRYLLDAGHRRIAVITGLAHTQPARRRIAGIQRAVRDAGLYLDNALVKYGDWEYSTGFSCMHELLIQERDSYPTAVFAMNDLMAVGAINAINAFGLSVPRDISVVGFDNREIASLVRPGLTTAEIDMKTIGREAARVAIEQINGNLHYSKSKDNIVMVPCKMILRDSVSECVEKRRVMVG